MCLFFKGVADEAHKVQTNPQALFVDYKNLFKNQYHLDVVDFFCCYTLWAGMSIDQPKRNGSKIFNYSLCPII